MMDDVYFIACALLIAVVLSVVLVGVVSPVWLVVRWGWRKLNVQWTRSVSR